MAGLTGFLFLSLLIISGDTARFFDRFFGIDKIIKFQRKFSLVTLLFIIFHPAFFIISDLSFFNFLLPDFSYIPLAAGTISFYVFIFVIIASKLYKKISYGAWQYIHILTYLLFFFVLYHAIYRGSDYKLLSIKIIYLLLFIFILLGTAYRTSYKIKNRSFNFFVKEVKWETIDTYTVILASNKKLDFKAGQFCFLRIDKEKLFARHPFTMSNPPEENTLNFTIKLKGRFTKTAAELKAGEKIAVEGPFGIFNIEDKNKSLVFIAGGVGITPFMSMIKDNLKKQELQKILLLYGAKTESDLIFKNELESIKEPWLEKIYVLSDQQGFINKEIIEKYAKEPKNSLFYICGPEPMKNSCKKALKTMGVKKNSIFIEDFFW